MFDPSGPPSCAAHDSAAAPSVSRPKAESCPVEYVVHKDSKPFAILNATPVLATRTVNGFALASPGAEWSLRASLR